MKKKCFRCRGGLIKRGILISLHALTRFGMNMRVTPVRVVTDET